jgi:hypothetical protein
MTRSMVMESTHGLTVDVMRVTGGRASNTDSDHI